MTKVAPSPEVLHEIADAMKKDPDTWWKGFGYVPSCSTSSGVSNFHSSRHVWLSLEVGYEIRRLPRTININVSVPEPMQEMPKYGQKFWFLSPASIKGYTSLRWDSDPVDYAAFKRGIWARESEVKQVAQAFYGSLKGGL